MKTGIILYVTGDPGITTDQDIIDKTARNLVPEADKVEIVGYDHGHWDISDAWRSLVVKGMHQIRVAMAEYSREGGMRLTGREMRLSG